MKLIPIDCTNGNILKQFPEFEETWKHKLPVSNDEYFICLKTIIDKLNNQISALIDEQETTNAILKLMELKTLQALYAQSQNFLSIK